MASWLTATVFIPLFAIVVLLFADLPWRKTVNQGQLFNLAISITAGAAIIEFFQDSKNNKGEVYRKVGVMLLLAASMMLYPANQKVEKGVLTTAMADWKIYISAATMVVSALVSCFSIGAQTNK